MYKTTLTKEELSALRAEGFIHVTGLSYQSCFSGEDGEFYFPKSQRGRWAEDKNGFIIVVLWNGEVWIRYSDAGLRYQEDGEDMSALVETLTKLLSETMGLTPVRFSVLTGRRGIVEEYLKEETFLLDMVTRISNPYSGVSYSNDPNPDRPRKKKGGKKRKSRELDFLADH